MRFIDEQDICDFLLEANAIHHNNTAANDTGGLKWKKHVERQAFTITGPALRELTFGDTIPLPQIHASATNKQIHRSATNTQIHRASRRHTPT
jgi:hypothetical protein